MNNTKGVHAFTTPSDGVTCTVKHATAASMLPTEKVEKEGSTAPPLPFQRSSDEHNNNNNKMNNTTATVVVFDAPMATQRGIIKSPGSTGTAAPTSGTTPTPLSSSSSGVAGTTTFQQPLPVTTTSFLSEGGGAVVVVGGGGGGEERRKEGAESF